MPWPGLALRRLERIGRIARQDRDVVALGRIQMDLAGIAPASAVSPVVLQTPLPTSHTAHVVPGDGSSGPIRRKSVPCSPCHHRHVAGVEIGPKGWNESCGRRRAAGGSGFVCAVGVDIEGAVFLNDPAIVV